MRDKLSVKFLLPALTIVAMMTIVTSLLISNKIESLLTSSAEEKIQSEVNYISLISNQMLKEKISSAMSLLIRESQKIGIPSLGSEVPLKNSSVPDILFGTTSQVQNYSLVDAVKSSLGGTATIFVRSGDDFIRVSTNVIAQDGQRAIGTKLDPNGKAIQAIREDKPFFGIVDILGKSYITSYEPIHDAFNNTIGIYYFGYEMSSISSLEDIVHNSKVLKNGFIALTDSRNKVIFSTEGVPKATVSEVLSGRKDSADWKIRTMDFSKNGFKIVSAYPVSDIKSDVRSAQFGVAIGGIIIAVILLGILYYITDKTIIKPINKLESLAGRIASGKMEESIDYLGKDEIGRLAAAFNEMLEKVRRQIGYMENLPAPVLIMDNNFTIQYINKAGAALVGKDQQKLIGEKCYDNFKTGHCRTDNCACLQAMKTGRTKTSETVARPGGHDIPILYTGAPLNDKEGRTIGALEYVADISEVKELQNYLASSTRVLLGEMEKFAEGDLCVKVRAEKDDEIGKLFNGFNSAVSKIRDMLLNISEAVNTVASSASEISATSEQIASGAQEQTAQTTAIAASIEQIAKSITSNSEKVNTAAENSRLASEDALKGAERVKETKTGIERIVMSTNQTGGKIASLAKRTDQIGEITQVIDDIADQTNLLALNAAIEAARAGELGRGFAVVADEVRKLAERTTKATKEIADTIKQIQSEAKEADSSMDDAAKAVEEGMALTETVAEALNQILQENRKVSDIVFQVAEASEAESQSAEEIGKSIEGITSVTQQSAQGTEQIARAAEDLNRLMVNLQELISRFNLGENVSLSGSSPEFRKRQYSTAALSE